MQPLSMNIARPTVRLFDSCLSRGTPFLCSQFQRQISSVSLEKCLRSTSSCSRNIDTLPLTLSRQKLVFQYANARTLNTCSILRADANDNKDDASVKDKESSPPEAKLSVFQRFKKTYKEHGKVLIGVHLATSAVWFGSFYYAASVGVDMVPLLQWLNFSEGTIDKFQNSGVGNVAVAYLLYKLATPARYTVTLGGTNLMVKYLRSQGRMAPKRESESLRSLAKDSQAELKTKASKFRSDMGQKGSKVRKNLKSKVLEKESRLKARQLSMKTKMKAEKNEVLAEFKQRRKVLSAKLKSSLRQSKRRKNSNNN